MASIELLHGNFSSDLLAKKILHNGSFLIFTHSIAHPFYKNTQWSAFTSTFVEICCAFMMTWYFWANFVFAPELCMLSQNCKSCIFLFSLFPPCLPDRRIWCKLSNNPGQHCPTAWINLQGHVMTNKFRWGGAVFATFHHLHIVYCQHFLNGGKLRNVYLGNAFYWNVVWKICILNGANIVLSFIFQFRGDEQWALLMCIFKLCSLKNTFPHEAHSPYWWQRDFQVTWWKANLNSRALKLTQHLCHTLHNDISYCCWFDLKQYH